VSLEIHPVTPERWPDMVALFERRGPRDEGGGASVWSIVCFVIDKPVQRTGLATALLDAAVEYAFAHGATSVEAYPHVANGSDYMGGVALYERAGFAKVRDVNKRAIVRIEQ